MSKTKKLTKWDIANKIDDFQRALGNYWRMPVWCWVDNYTRQELVDYYNGMVRRHGGDRPEII